MKIDFNLEQDLQNLINYESTEVYVDHSDNNCKVYIPYMLSDMVECFLQFSNCTIQGSWDKTRDGIIDFSLTDNEGKKGIVFRQKTDHVFTIWYDSVEKHVETYQYHRTGHFWIEGQEPWRRIVYIIGTMNDKYSFMGQDICNQEELELIPLSEFGPFSYWTPIDESFEDYYPFSQEGIDCAKRIARKIGDRRLAGIARRYEKALVADRLTERRLRRYAKQLTRDDKLYEYLNQQIDKASLQYAPRPYSPRDQERMNALRQQVEEEYRRKGYLGKYPCLTKHKHQVKFYEEHPYILQDFEYDNFSFRIYALEKGDATHPPVMYK